MSPFRQNGTALGARVRSREPWRRLTARAPNFSRPRIASRFFSRKQTTFAHFAQDARPRRKKSSLGRVLLDGARAVAWLTAALGGERVRGPLGLFRLGRRLPGRFAVSDLFGRESPTGPPMQPPSADSPRRTRPTSIRACSTCCSSPTRPRPSASQPRASVADSRGSSGSRCSCRECPLSRFGGKATSIHGSPFHTLLR